MSCDNCVHLEWEFGDVNDPDGYVCKKRRYDAINPDIEDRRESNHLSQLARDSYRAKHKKCCELRPVVLDSSHPGNEAQQNRELT